jgi:hypothetical protein
MGLICPFPLFVAQMVPHHFFFGVFVSFIEKLTQAILIFAFASWEMCSLVRAIALLYVVFSGWKAA